MKYGKRIKVHTYKLYVKNHDITGAPDFELEYQTTDKAKAIKYFYDKGIGEYFTKSELRDLVERYD